MVLTLGSDCHALQHQIKNCHIFLNSYKWLTDSFVLDFFSENHWAKLPSSWAHTLDLLSLEEMGKSILSPDGLCSTSKLVLPLSLLAFKAAAKSLALERTAITSLEQIISYLSELGFKNATQQSGVWVNPSSECKPTGALGSLTQVFHRQVKPKKQHELYRMGQCCATISEVTKCKTVVDVGAGVGHLSRFLSYGYGLDLLCLECVETFGSAAVKLDGKLEEACVKLGIANITTPKHITLTLNPNTSNLVELLNSHGFSQITACGLVGLHTCGDLGPTLIRNFAVDPGIKFILAIGCCYMKMSLDRYLLNSYH